MALTILDRAPRMRRFLVYDLEWVPGTLEVRLVGCYDGTRYRAYRSVGEFLDAELTSKNRGAWFYAHSGGLHDFQFISREIDLYNERAGRDLYKLDAKLSGSSAIIVNVSRGKNGWHFLDSYWTLRDKLANIGKWIGLSKGATVQQSDDPDEEGITDEEYERRMALRRQWYATVKWEDLRDYNYIDCKILWHAIDAFENVVLDLGGQLQMTIASTGMHLFRRKYLMRDIPTNAYVNACARDAYTASRVEVLQREVWDAWYYDINSSFPFAMTYPCPGEYLGSSRMIPDNPDAIYLADVDIVQEDQWLPPISHRIDGRVFFPLGRWRTWLSSIDVQELQSCGGRIERVHEVLTFAPFEDLAGYATDIYTRRKNAKSDFEKVALKFLLNCLYGKFAESPTKSALMLNPSRVPVTRAEQESMGMKMLFPGAWIRETEVPIPHQWVPISVHITAVARRTLHRLMTQCQEVHYCDTDGFSTPDAFPTSADLGGLKLERRNHHVTYVASKLYDMDGEVLKDGAWLTKRTVKGKGFSRMSPSRFAALLEGEAITYERMARLKENWKLGITMPREVTITKQIRIKSPLDPDFDRAKHSLPKRFPYPDGHTRPWHLSELAA